MTKTIAQRVYANATDYAAIVADAKVELKRERIPFIKKDIVSYYVPTFCVAYGCEARAKDKGEGFTWPTRKVNGKNVRTKDAEAAKKACEKLADDVLGVGNKAEKPEMEIPAHILKAAAALRKMCDEYEQSRTLANKAVATVFAK